jgi:hypothetical protein
MSLTVIRMDILWAFPLNQADQSISPFRPFNLTNFHHRLEPKINREFLILR